MTNSRLLSRFQVGHRRLVTSGLLVLLLSGYFCAGAFCQNARWDLGAPGSAGAVTVSGSGGLQPLLALPGVSLNFCNYPANASPCTNFANTYTSISSSTLCPTSSPIVLQGSSTCVGTSDNLGNLGVYTLPGTYAYTLTVSGVSSGPYVVTVTGTNASANFPGISVPVEFYGAIGDWNGTTGTDNTVAIQNCLNSLSSGVCFLQAKAYKITGTLTISKSSVGIAGVLSVPTSPIYATSPGSQIISTSASADIIDLAGTNNLTGNVAHNLFRNFRLSRSVAPSGTARGLSIVNSAGVTVQNVVSEDSIQDFYCKGCGSDGSGVFENDTALWGYNGITESTGIMFGFFVDSSGGIGSPSYRLRNCVAASLLGHSAGSVWSTFGFVATGTEVSDWHLTHPEAANTDYGIYLSSTGTATALANLDIQIVDPILQVWNSAISVKGLAGPYSSFTVTGGLSSINVGGGATPAIDIETSANVKIMNHTILYESNATQGVLALSSFNVQLIGNTFEVGAAGIPAIFYSGSEGGQVEATTFSGVSATSLIQVGNTQALTVAANSMEGSATNGILIDSSSHRISGLETNACGTAGGTITNCVVDNGGNSGSQVLLCSPTQPTVTSGFNAGFIGTNPNGTCSFYLSVGVGTAGSTGVIGLPTARSGWNCFANNANRAALIQETAGTASSATLTNYGTTFAATNFTNSDVLLVSCFAR